MVIDAKMAELLSKKGGEMSRKRALERIEEQIREAANKGGRKIRINSDPPTYLVDELGKRGFSVKASYFYTTVEW